MMLSQATISKTKRLLRGREPEVAKEYRAHLAMADLTRIKIVFLLKKHKELCPTDIANVLNVTLSAVSHQLRTLERFGIVKKIRKGKMICYSLVNPQRSDINLGLNIGNSH